MAAQGSKNASHLLFYIFFFLILQVEGNTFTRKPQAVATPGMELALLSKVC